MDYIRFGRGQRHLIMLPGLGDSLRSVKGTAVPMALMYRIFAKDFTVWMFSRKHPLKQPSSTRELARDQAEAMDALGIPKADILGVSMGGMIAQWLAADYPEKTRKLVLAVTSPRPNPILTESIEEWVTYAGNDDPAGFMDSNLRRIYSEDYYRKNKWMAPLVGRLTKPKSYERFFIQADACLTHDAYETLSSIQARTLVVGGEQDKALGGDASREIAARIPGAKLHMYQQWGHGLYEEAKDFNSLVLTFLLEE
jgi:pimeloyl-ACP methyl ester carboxylesterase